MNRVDEAKPHSPICSTFEILFVLHVATHCHGKEFGHSVDQCWLQMLQFALHLISLLTILLICNGFNRIMKAVVDQTSSRPQSSDHDFFWCKFHFEKVLWSQQCLGLPTLVPVFLPEVSAECKLKVL